MVAPVREAVIPKDEEESVRREMMEKESHVAIELEQGLVDVRVGGR